MVFTRLLKKLKGHEAISSEGTAGSDLANALLNVASKKRHPGPAGILSEVQGELDSLIKIMKDEFAGRMENPLRAFACFGGQLNGPSFKSPKTHFLFLRIPGRPGLLIEEGSEECLIFRATEAKSLLWNENEAQVDRTPLFTRKANPLGRLVSIQGDLWELFWEEKPRQTLSSRQLAEVLLAKAVQEMNTGQL